MNEVIPYYMITIEHRGRGSFDFPWRVEVTSPDGGYVRSTIVMWHWNAVRWGRRQVRRHIRMSSQAERPVEVIKVPVR